MSTWSRYSSYNLHKDLSQNGRGFRTGKNLMAIEMAQWLTTAVGLYLLIGLVVAIPFVIRGAGKIDPSAREASTGFRLLIVPGSIALWPLVLRRWLGGHPPPEESSAHRRAAREQ